MAERRVKVGAVELVVAEQGAGGRPLLLVHGFTGAKEDFEPLTGLLAAAGWHTAAPDLRGHGASDHPIDPQAYDLGELASDVLAVADDLGWERFVLAGHSMGGAVAQRLAIDAPGRVEALVLVSTFHGPLDVDPGLVNLGLAIVRQGGMPALAAALAARRAQDPEAVAARDRIERASPGHGARLDAKLLACSADMWAALAPRFPQWPDTLAEAGAISVPTLVLVGDEDETMLPHCRRLAAAIPGARLEVLAGVRHSPQLEAPDRTWTALSAFLAALA